MALRHPYAPMEGYVVNFLHRNFWKVEGYVEREDVLQQARAIYYKLLRKYGKAVDGNQRWFMALFMRSFQNYFNGLCSQRLTAADHECSLTEIEDDANETWMPLRYDQNSGYLLKLLEEATGEVGAILQIVLHAPPEVLHAMVATWKQSNRRKPESSRFFIELLNLSVDPRTTDVVREVEQYLLGTDDSSV